MYMCAVGEISSCSIHPSLRTGNGGEPTHTCVYVHTEEEEGEGEEERAEYEEQLAELEAEEMEEEEDEEEEEDADAKERMKGELTDRYEEENDAVNSLQVLNTH